jgi:hypothetical protein
MEEIIIKQCPKYANLKDSVETSELDLADGWWGEVIIYNKDLNQFFHSEIYLFDFLQKMWDYLEKVWNHKGQVFTLVGFDQDYFFNVKWESEKFIITIPIRPVEGIKTEHYIYDFESFIMSFKAFTLQSFEDAETILSFLDKDKDYQEFKSRLSNDCLFFKSNVFAA